MCSTIFKSPLLLLCFISTVSIAAIPDKISLKSTVDIENRGEGLKEPSGLTLSHGKKALWTVSDNTSKIFKLSLDGQLKKTKSIDVDVLGLEGIAIGIDGLFLYVISENENSIAKVNIDEQMVTDLVYLDQIQGFNQMQSDYPEHFNVGNNNGIEGITVHPETEQILLLKESGLLIVLSTDMQEIEHYYNLTFAKDYSGICFEDAYRNRVWMVSDDSKKLYLFDLDDGNVDGSFKLKKSNGDTYDSAEGVSYDPTTRNLYIVTDNKQKLRRYKVRY